MNKDVFTREDLLGKAGVSEEVLSGWIEAKLVRPGGYRGGQDPPLHRGSP